jgi:hypothetical protein
LFPDQYILTIFGGEEFLVEVLTQISIYQIKHE